MPSFKCCEDPLDVCYQLGGAAMLAIDNVSRRFGSKTAVSDINLHIPSGSFVGIIGRSGAGKSTLLRMINRLVEPSVGSISFDDRNVTQLKGKDLRNWRSDCAMIFQQFNLVGRMDVLTNVLTGRLNKVSNVQSLLRMWSIEDRTIALSALEQFEIANLHFGITVICNLHSLEIAREYCDRLVGMAQGRIVFDDVPEALTADKARELYGIEAGDVMAQDAVNTSSAAKEVFNPVGQIPAGFGTSH
eukprot:gene15237-15383_t